MNGNVYEVDQLELFSSAELETCDTRPKEELVLKTFENPRNDNEVLFNLQYDYLINHNEAAFWQMWELTAKVARRLAIKKIKARGLSFAPDEVENLAADTCEYLLRRFKKKYKSGKQYRIKDNFIIAIKDSLRHALDYQNEIDGRTDYIDYSDLCRFQTTDNYDFLRGEDD